VMESKQTKGWEERGLSAILEAPKTVSKRRPV